MSAVTRHPVPQPFDCGAEVDVLLEGVATACVADGPEFDALLVWFGFYVLTENTPTIELHHHFVDGEYSSRCEERCGVLLTAVSRLPSFASRRCAVLNVAGICVLFAKCSIVNSCWKRLQVVWALKCGRSYICEFVK